jgi:uncharacterized protein YegL
MNEWLTVDESDLIHNRSQRAPLCICIENSRYIRGCKSDIDKSIKTLFSDIGSDVTLKASTDVCVLSYSDEVTVLREFGNFLFGRNAAPELPVTSDTESPCLDLCIDKAVKKIRKRRKDYYATDNNFYRPTLIILSSGAVRGDDSLFTAAEISNKFEDMGTVIPILLGNGSRANLEKLTAAHDVYKCTDNITELFDLIRCSLVSLSESSSSTFANLLSCQKDKWDELK